MIYEDIFNVSGSLKYGTEGLRDGMTRGSIEFPSRIPSEVFPDRPALDLPDGLRQLNGPESRRQGASVMDVPV